jgi:hypothetical protein
MPTRSNNIHLLRQRVIESDNRSSPQLLGSKLTETGVLDRAALNRQLAEILEGLSDQSGLAARLEQLIEVFLEALKGGDVPHTAKQVCAILSVELDDLRKAAVLSLMVRLVGKRKFDPIAAYILQNQKVLVTAES